MPTFEEDQLIAAAAESDIDALMLIGEQLRAMIPMRMVCRQPKSANNKILLSIRYSPEVVDYVKSSRAGWQASVDAVLKDYVVEHTAGDANGA
jgi:uncharacterized protein (DUF4415 family)